MMALEQITFNIGAFNDANAGGNNYYPNTVFEVKKQIDNSFATIYSDGSGINQIPQNGIDNISDSVGECEFWVDTGDYYIEVDLKKKNFSAGTLAKYVSNESGGSAQDFFDNSGIAAIDVAEMKLLTPSSGDVVNTSKYYSDALGGGGSYDILSPAQYTALNGGSPDEYVDITLANGNIAALRLGADGYCTFKQAGIKVFATESDPSFKSIDAGVILNALNGNSRVLGLRSNWLGRIYSNTQYIDTKGTYFECVRVNRLDQLDEQSFKIVFDKDTVITDTKGGAFTVESGVRKGGIKGLIIKEESGGSFEALFSLGNNFYSDDTDYIISGYETKHFFTQGGDKGIRTYQHFGCEFSDTSPRDFRSHGFFHHEGGTSVLWQRCFPLSNVDGAVSFEWDRAATGAGHIYSTMLNCAAQLTDGGGYVFRNCVMSIIDCAEEFCAAEETMVFVGTGTYTVQNYDCVHRNTDKPNYIYGVRPTVAGRFGATLNIDNTTLGVTSFSGDKVQFMKYGDEPTSILSNAKWNIPNTNYKSDPTSAIDFDTWKAGSYYEQFVLIEYQLNSIDTYTRNNHSVANIPIDINCRTRITAEIEAAAGTGESLTFDLEVYLGSKLLVEVATAINVIDTANADTTNRGKLMHLDNGQNLTYATGNLYLLSYSQASATLYASFTSGVLRLEMRSSGGGSVINQTGKYIIRKERYSV